MDSNTVLVFTRPGLGDAPSELQQKLAFKFLSLINQSDLLPSKILFYAEGVKLACTGSAVLEPLQALQAKGVELILCSTCLDFYTLTDQVQAGIVGGMPDIIEAISKAGKVVSL